MKLVHYMGIKHLDMGSDAVLLDGLRKFGFALLHRLLLQLFDLLRASLLSQHLHISRELCSPLLKS